MNFVSGSSLRDAIAIVVAGRNLRMAVAFWGAGAKEFLALGKRSDWKVICNLAMGGTNPDAIRALQDPVRCSEGHTTRIRESDRLHAKVFVSDAGAIVGSSNVSANGLGLEGRELTGWIESALFTSDTRIISEARQWFDDLWESKRESRWVTDTRLTEVKPIYRKRRGARPAQGKPELLDIGLDEFPLISWWEDYDDFHINDEFQGDIRQAIDDGHELEHPEDADVLLPGRWVLWWEQTKDGLPDSNTLTWTRLSGIARKCGQWTTEPLPSDVALADLSPGPVPIPLSARFKRRLREKLSEKRFTGLINPNYRGRFFTERRLALMQALWSDLL